MKHFCMVVLMATFSLASVAQTATTTPTEQKKTTPKKKGLIGHAVEQADQGYYGMSGCGLGSVLFGETESKGGQILSSTTNSTYSNNTFGMSTGSSNCVPEKEETTTAMKKNVEIFVAANREALATDIAKSNGETIITLGSIMGCRDTNYLGAKLQSRYETIFDTKEEKTIAGNMLETVSTDRYLLENCRI